MTRPLRDAVWDFASGLLIRLRFGRSGCFACSRPLPLRSLFHRWAGMACSHECWHFVVRVMRKYEHDINKAGR